MKQKIVGYLENRHSNKLSDGLKGEKKLYLVLELGELFSFVLDFGKLLVLTFNTLESGSECWIPECLKGEKATTSKFIYKWPSK